MTGRVEDSYPVLPVTFGIPNQPDLRIDCVIDTGFAGFLTLPPAAISALGFSFFYRLPANLADDTNITVDVYTATILWQGTEREVEILAMGKRPLIGRALLSDNRLGIEFWNGGAVVVSPKS
jgi:clan AA aspartic protease